MTAIGGYLEGEWPTGGPALHAHARLALKSGRACLRHLVDTERPPRVLVPFFTCDAVTEPLVEAGVAVEYYGVDERLEMRPAGLSLGSDERLVFINYFGLKDRFVAELERSLGRRLWVDNTQAFFWHGSDTRCYRFNSARKFFGVPDGAYLYAPADAPPCDGESLPRNTDYRVEHLVLRQQGRVQEGFDVFCENERAAGTGVARISVLSEALLGRLDFTTAAARRRANYRHLQRQLQDENRLDPGLTDLPEDAVPLCYPFLPRRPIDRRYLWDRRIYVPAFWPECLNRTHEGFRWERELAGGLLPLPIDHRYADEEMQLIVEAIRDHGP